MFEPLIDCGQTPLPNPDTGFDEKRRRFSCPNPSNPLKSQICFPANTKVFFFVDGDTQIGKTTVQKHSLTSISPSFKVLFR